MTCVWAWADLGDHVLQTFNIRQYWLIMSVLSVKKFNPNWKRVFFVDKQTYDFLNSKQWIYLWDEVNIVDFKNTEYGNLYDISIYSWPKIYSYGLVDDDILIMDIDIVFINSFEVVDYNKMGGNIYDFINDLTFDYTATTPINLSHNWVIIDCVQNTLCDTSFKKMTSEDLCVVGAPIYCPRHLNKNVQQVINHIIKIESIYGGLLPDQAYQTLEEEYPIAQIGVNNGGIWQINNNLYRHGFTSQTFYNIESGYSKPESILEEDVFNKYIN